MILLPRTLVSSILRWMIIYIMYRYTYQCRYLMKNVTFMTMNKDNIILYKIRNVGHKFIIFINLKLKIHIPLFINYSLLPSITVVENRNDRVRSKPKLSNSVNQSERFLKLTCLILTVLLFIIRYRFFSRIAPIICMAE